MPKMKLLPLLFLLGVEACGSSQQFAAIPSDLDRERVPKQSLDISAERYKFTPELIRVNKGTLLTLRITSIEGTHGFQLKAFGIDVRLDEHETKIVELYAGERGEYPFRCSHLCGIGHLGMTGKIIVQ